jgi:hypothetical protein
LANRPEVKSMFQLHSSLKNKNKIKNNPKCNSLAPFSTTIIKLVRQRHNRIRRKKELAFDCTLSQDIVRQIQLDVLLHHLDTDRLSHSDGKTNLKTMNNCFSQTNKNVLM